MKQFLQLGFFLLLTGNLFAQQDPLYAQYFNNPMLINPAMAGSSDRLFVGLGYRTQWSGIEGGPVSYNFNSHMSIVNNRVGVGVIMTGDKLGESQTMQYAGAFSYRMKLSNATFSFGMQAGIVQYQANMNGVQVLNPDPLFVPYSSSQFNTGVGLLLKSERYTLGLSAPHLLPNSLSQNTDAPSASDQNYYLFGSYLFYLGERMQLSPSTLLRMTKGSSLSVDLNMNFTFDRKYTVGLMARSLNTYGGLLQLVLQNTRLSYMFELPGKSSALNFNTHEISLALSLDVLASHDHELVKF